MSEPQDRLLRNPESAVTWLNNPVLQIAPLDPFFFF